MTEWWRTISSDEAALIRTVVSAANIPGSDALVDNLDAALMSHATEWILDVYPSTSARTTLPNTEGEPIKPEPRADQLMPSHLAIFVAAPPPAVVNKPPA